MSDPDQSADPGVGHRAGYSAGVILRCLILGLALSVSVVALLGHDGTTRVFRYEGF